MFPTTHDNKPASVYCFETAVYAVYDDGDAFFYVETDDVTVDLETELTREFGEELAEEVLMELGVR